MNTEGSQTTGTVDWFDEDRGVGSIRPDDGTGTCSVGVAALQRCNISSLAAGDRVRFTILEADGERTAVDLSLIRQLERWENEGGAVPDSPPN